MGFANTTCSFTRFRILDPVPDGLWTTVEDRLKQHAFQDIDGMAEMQSKGWVCFEDMLDNGWRDEIGGQAVGAVIQPLDPVAVAQGRHPHRAALVVDLGIVPGRKKIWKTCRPSWNS